jgi:hypothetical protein
VSLRLWAIATVIFGVASLGMFLAFAMLPEMRAAAACLPPGSVVQFEFARNAQDLVEIFGEPSSACRPLAIAAMDAVNRLDVLAFIPLYTAFGIAGAMFLAGGAPRLLGIAAILAALGALAGDYLETTTLLAITQNLDAAEPLLPHSQLGAWSKFALLAAHSFFCAGLCFFGERRRAILGALLVLPALGVSIAALDHVQYANVMNATFGVAWVALLAMAARALLPAKAA